MADCPQVLHNFSTQPFGAVPGLAEDGFIAPDARDGRFFPGGRQRGRVISSQKMRAMGQRFSLRSRTAPQERGGEKKHPVASIEMTGGEGPTGGDQAEEDSSRAPQKA
jgi:hypothetical protein